MRITLLSITAIALLCLGFNHTFNGNEPISDARPIKEVMAETMKSGLIRKVVSGDATDEEKVKFLDHFIDLTENEPPKGEADAWATKTNRILALTAKVMVGREGAGEELKKEANCMACHKEFKP